jgi:hypothetical protein
VASKKAALINTFQAWFITEQFTQKIKKIPPNEKPDTLWGYPVDQMAPTKGLKDWGE